MNVSEFRSTLPEFSDASQYGDSQIESLIDLADELMVSKRWKGAIKERATALFVAHHLVIDSQNNAGGSPGSIQGPVQHKSVGGVDVDYNLEYVMHDNGSYWNTTNYGIQFLRLARMIGAGPVQASLGDVNNGLRIWV